MPRPASPAGPPAWAKEAPCLRAADGAAAGKRGERGGVGPSAGNKRGAGIPPAESPWRPRRGSPPGSSPGPGAAPPVGPGMPVGGLWVVPTDSAAGAASKGATASLPGPGPSRGGGGGGGAFTGRAEAASSPARERRGGLRGGGCGRGGRCPAASHRSGLRAPPGLGSAPPPRPSAPRPRLSRGLGEAAAAAPQRPLPLADRQGRRCHGNRGVALARRPPGCVGLGPEVSFLSGSGGSGRALAVREAAGREGKRPARRKELRRRHHGEAGPGGRTRAGGGGGWPPAPR